MTKQKVITEEKKAEYKKTRQDNVRRKKETRKLEKEQGRTGERRLAFLFDIILSYGLTFKQVAAMIDMSPDVLYWYNSTSDDCKLSIAEKILDALGLTLSVKLEKKPVPAVLMQKEVAPNHLGGPGRVTTRVEGLLKYPAISRNLRYPRYLEEVTPDSRLYFLKEAILESHLSIAKFSQNVGIDSTCIRYYFQRNDIIISSIYKIAAGMNYNIVWKVYPKGYVPEDENPADNK